MKLKSYAVGANGYYDYGLCQINKGYHSKIVNDPRFFTDYKRQLDKCREKFKGGTRFYGFDVRYKRSKGLIEIDGVKY